MALRQKFQHYLREEVNWSLMHLRYYRSNVDWKRLRPMILKRINNRVNDYPLKSMTPVANDVLESQKLLIQGVSTLLKVIPAKSCKYCPEVYIGSRGHQIKSCHGFKRIKKDQEHRWIDATVNDILSPVEAFHLQTMFQPMISHDQRFDFDRIPAVLELCFQAGAKVSDGTSYNLTLDAKELYQIGQETLDAWEKLRDGVQKLLFVYPAKVCEHCSEVHIGPSGNKVRACGVFRYEGWRGAHRWRKAGVDDLVPLKLVWHQRPHDPEVLGDAGRGYYGHSPAVVELCMQAGARVPKKYFCMMKLLGLTPNVVEEKGMKV
ncbi:APO protein 4, mitochondrial-like [Asparagus officinalis]|uniref:APO protein 4, mitochondrial-like n=1 Tax=Asparagus officinalis TaxID=4686 RepID=UPI00098E6B81|nr:APO protein 4, mitochondrial-like [Asparagus officinalis]